nr:unnamed protein product [Callosobruchus analis]
MLKAEDIADASSMLYRRLRTYR